jgi:hypothetical protein
MVTDHLVHSGAPAFTLIPCAGEPRDSLSANLGSKPLADT